MGMSSGNEARREGARKANGEFGSWQAQENAGVQLDAYEQPFVRLEGAADVKEYLEWEGASPTNALVLDGGTFTELDLTGKELGSGISANEARFEGLIAPGMDFSSGTNAGTDFTSATFEITDLTGSDLTRVEAGGADFTDLAGVRTKWVGAVAYDSVFDGAALADSDFTNADLRRASFYGADLRGVNFTGADIDGAVFTGAITTGATFDDTTRAIGLEGHDKSAMQLADKGWATVLRQGSRARSSDAEEEIAQLLAEGDVAEAVYEDLGVRTVAGWDRTVGRVTITGENGETTSVRMDTGARAEPPTHLARVLSLCAYESAQSSGRDLEGFMEAADYDPEDVEGRVMANSTFTSAQRAQEDFERVFGKERWAQYVATCEY